MSTGLARAQPVAAQDAPAFTLPKLPYEYDALEPHIDARTMRIHHDLHHQAYVTGLNTALMGHADLQKTPLDQLLRNIDKVPQTIRQRVTNHGAEVDELVQPALLLAPVEPVSPV